MLKNPSPWPNWSDGLRIVQSRPETRDEGLGLGLGARVVEGRVVGDAQRAHVDEPRTPAACIAATTARVPSVLTRRRSRAAVEVARDRDEVDDGVDAGQSPARGSPGG